MKNEERRRFAAMMALTPFEDYLTEQEYKVLRGNILHNDISGAFIGLGRLLRRKGWDCATE